MRDILMWSALIAFGGCLYLSVYITRTRWQIAADLEEMKLRADELSEASALIDYGAYQEAVEVLRRARKRETA